MSLLENVFASLTRTPPRGGIEAKVEAELVRVAYQSAGFGVCINVVVPVIIAYVLWGHFPAATLVTWASLMALVSVGRHLLHRRFLAVPQRSLEELPAWTHGFRLGALLIAALWGFASWTFLAVDETVHQVFIVFIVTGLMAGAARSLSPIPACFTPYAVLALTPIIVRNLVHPENGGVALALLTVLYIVFLTLTAREQRNEMVRMYRTLIENEALMTDLREAKQRAEVANRAKGEFLSAISHEIHTPMHGVLGMLQLLEQAELQQEQRVQVDVAINSANALHGLLKDVLDFSQIESGRLEIAHTPFSLPFKSTRRNTNPWSTGAGFNVSETGSPVCSALPWMETSRAIVRCFIDRCETHSFDECWSPAQALICPRLDTPTSQRLKRPFPTFNHLHACPPPTTSAKAK